MEVDGLWCFWFFGIEDLGFWGSVLLGELFAYFIMFLR